jgi:hypothetical protein
MRRLSGPWLQAAWTLALPRREARLVVFLVPGHNWRSGGVLSIVGLFHETLGLRSLHGAGAVLCTIPGDPPLARYTWFRNRERLLRLPAVLRRCDRLESVLVHIPEYAVDRVAAWLRSDEAAPLLRIRSRQFNVLIQNIDQVREQDIRGLGAFGEVTCTAGHRSYANAETRRRLGVPLHWLSVSNDPSRYARVDYAQKEPLMVVSPDPHPDRERILDRIRAGCPGLAVRTIQDLSYEAYRRLIGRAKWSLTFGEGLDNYFAEPVFCGGVSFAVYNPRFFTPEFAGLPPVYPSWADLERNIVGDLRAFDNPGRYREIAGREHALVAGIYSDERFRDNLRRFHRREYTLP